jgi:hypothetical protein
MGIMPSRMRVACNVRIMATWVRVSCNVRIMTRRMRVTCHMGVMALWVVVAAVPTIVITRIMDRRRVTTARVVISAFVY